VFREALNQARSLANALPGGELLIEEQDEIIAMLERLREKKRYVVVIRVGRNQTNESCFIQRTTARVLGHGD
jgi:hypothetical protein